MSYSLSFSPEFFGLPGELYDSDYTEEHGDRPYSVIGALRALDEDTWINIAVDVFGMGDDMAEYLTIESVLDKIRETDMCTDLRSPVAVWIDPEGYYTIDVYDRDGRPEM